MAFDFFSLEAVQHLAHQYGYAAVFFGILLENAGIPLPGETITLAGGFLAGSGELNYGLVLASAIAGAVIGDNCGYWIGAYKGWEFLLRVGQVFRLSEAQLESVKAQFSANAAKAVILGRFVALLRIFAGPLAGVAEMPYGQFVLCNLVGATLWATVTVSLAFFAGRLVPLSQLATWASQFAIVTLVLITAWIAIPWWLESRKRQIGSED